MSTTTLRIAHFNDVYRVQPFKIDPKSNETIDVTQFAQGLNDVRASWPDRADGGKDGLVLFSGDVFSPSVQSSVTRGSHMVPVMNELAPDVSMVGNHDFDFGYPHLTKLIEATKFPWLLSNIVDNTTGKVPKAVLEYHILERAGIRIGFIGLVEKEWIGTVSSWPSNFEYRDMAETGKTLSQKLRDPSGPHKVDLVIALTHARVPNDIGLARALSALSPSAQSSSDFVNSHGADLLLGGHDHLYYVSRGVDGWDGFNPKEPVLGAENDKGDVLVVKSGTDFRDLSEISLELSKSPEGGARNYVISRITGRRIETKPGSASSQRMGDLLKDVIDSVDKSLSAPVCKTSVPLDVRSQYIRTAESASGNWFADIIQHAYDDALCVQGYNGVDMVFICAGMLRGDSVYGPGDITLGNILEILPFEDPLVVIEVDGKTVWDALEASLSTWPAQEGRFPVISGFRITWDSRKKPGERVLSVHLSKRLDDDGQETEETEVKNEQGGQKYRLLTREYMAQGHDGFVALKDHKFLIDDESGQMMSAIVRKYLLGSLYVHKMARLQTSEGKAHTLENALHPDTTRILARERNRLSKHAADSGLTARQMWRLAASRVLHATRAGPHYRDHIGVAAREHMSDVDCYDGHGVRSGKRQEKPKAPERKASHDQDLLTISPEIDGRLKDEGRS